ncbi:MAG: 2-C-methyl-D-erythritol 2,4-cyclodiphosphate synthase [Actinomycetes bacterium]
MRIGQGFDVHAFSDDPTRPLLLCGVRIPEAPGLVGHSDADVATHALLDALLGGAALGDLGRHFDDTDPAHAGADSLEMLAEVLRRVADEGWAPTSADITIVAQVPRLAGFMAEMADTLSEAMGIIVSVKATTTEQLGFLGRGEGIAAMAVALLEAI